MLVSVYVVIVRLLCVLFMLCDLNNYLFIINSGSNLKISQVFIASRDQRKYILNII